MPKPRNLHPKPLLDDEYLGQYLAQNGVKATHKIELWKALCVNERMHWPDPAPTTYSDAWSHDEWMNRIRALPSQILDPLSAEFAPLTTRVVHKSIAGDGQTCKLIIELQDGHQVESVIMMYKGRNTLCVSSQIGCRMGCRFCATGTMGEIGNLHAGEILEQLVHANRVARIRNIVFMGMGEPMVNYDAVVAAVRVMTDPRCFGLSQKYISVSTVGIIPRIMHLADDLPDVNLAVSLHAPNQELRQRIVPSARAYKLDRLIAACDEYIHRTGRTVMMEYVLLKGVNDSDETAHELGRLLLGKAVIVNVIPYNPNFAVGIEEFEAPTDEEAERFCAIIKDQYQLYTTIRAEMGQDVSGACGQLALVRMPTQKGEHATFVEGVEGMGVEVEGEQRRAADDETSTAGRRGGPAGSDGDDAASGAGRGAASVTAIEDLGKPQVLARTLRPSQPQQQPQRKSLAQAALRAKEGGAATKPAAGGCCGGGACGGGDGGTAAASASAGGCCKGEAVRAAGGCCRDQGKGAAVSAAAGGPTLEYAAGEGEEAISCGSADGARLRASETGCCGGAQRACAPSTAGSAKGDEEEDDSELDLAGKARPSRWTALGYSVAAVAVTLVYMAVRAAVTHGLSENA